MEQLEQLLTCCVCLDRYRNPKLLPCQHSFCMEPCMEGLVDYVRRQVKCPECRAEHRIPYQGVQAFPTNVTLQRFLELHGDLTGELPDPTTNQIMERCQVCSEKAYLNPCAHCEKKVCPDCKDAHLDVIKREITRMSGQVRRVLTRLEDALNVTDRNLAGLKGNQAHVLDEVDDLIRRFTKAINDKGSALRHELESYVTTELATLNTYKTNLETEINNIQSNCDLVDKHMINEGTTITWDDQELMDTKDIFLKTIEFIRNFEYEPGDRRIRFSTTQDPNTVIVGLSNFGDLTLPHSIIVTNARQPPFQQQQQQLQAPSGGIMRSKSDHRLVQQYRDMDDMDDRPAGRERKFRSRFARRLMGQDDDDSRVRFDDADDQRPSTSTKTRVIDTEDAVKGPMSAIPRMLDSTRVLEKLVDYESPKKKPAAAGPAVPLEVQAQMVIMQQQQIMQQQRQHQQQQQATAAAAAAPPPQAPRRQTSQDKSNQNNTPKSTPTPTAPVRKQASEKARTESESSSSEASSSETRNAAPASTSRPTEPPRQTPVKATTPSSVQTPAKPSPTANNTPRRNPTPQASREEESDTSSEESEEESESDEPTAPPARNTASRDRDPPQPSRSRQRDTRSQVEESPRSRDPPESSRRFSRDEGSSSGYHYRTRNQSPAERLYGSGSGSSAASRYGTSSTSSPYDSGLSRSRTGTGLYEPEVPVPTSRIQAKYLNRSRPLGGSVDIPDDYRSPGKPYYSGRNAYLTNQVENKDQWNGRDKGRGEKSKILSRSKSSHELAQAELELKSPEEEQQNLSSWARYLKSKYGKTVATDGKKDSSNNNNNNQMENGSESDSNTTRGKSASPPSKLNNPLASQYSGKKRLVFKFGARGSDPGYFTWPRGIACGPDGSVIVADSSNHRIQVFDAQGAFVKDFGTYGNGDGEFDCLAGVAVNRIGQFIVSDRYNHRIQVFDPSGRFLRSFGSQGSTDGKFNYPWGVTTDALGFIYVCDKENNRIQVFQSDGTFVGKFGVGELENPHYIAVTCTNKVVVSDTGHHRIYICDVNGKFIGSIGTEGIEHGQFKLPRGVAVDEQGYIFVGDSGNNRIQIFNPDGVHIKSFGGWGSGDGEFKGLEGIAVNSNGNVLVCDRENHRIQVF